LHKIHFCRAKNGNSSISDLLAQRGAPKHCRFTPALKVCPPTHQRGKGVKRRCPKPLFGFKTVSHLLTSIFFFFFFVAMATHRRATVFSSVLFPYFDFDKILAPTSRSHHPPTRGAEENGGKG
jgi:hypothetical protein